MNHETPRSTLWLRRLGEGEPRALGHLFDLYRPRLRRMVEVRLDSRLAGRVDPSDVLQDAYLEATRKVKHYLENPSVAFYVWLRGIMWERLVMLERRHLGAECRAVARECRLPADSSVALGHQLLGPRTTPSQGLMREEVRRRVQAMLEQLDPEDREVILLRHFEGLTNGEVAQTVGLTESGASRRYGRALFRLKQMLLEVGPWGN